MAESDFLCSTYSKNAGEPLPGTAPFGQVWFLLEYNGAWESKAFESSLIAEEVKTWFSAAVQKIPGAKLLLIRSGSANRAANLRPQSPASIRKGQGISFYMAAASQVQPLLYRFQLYSYSELMEMDLIRLAQGDPRYTAHQSGEKLFLVCTHGRRDRCCARDGSLVFEAMCLKAARLGLAENVWQCSHVGGHRFAANVVCFPHSIFYGRVGLENIDELIGSYLEENYLPSKARGRTCLEGPAQAAEIFLRQITGLTDLNAFAPVQYKQVAERLWEVNFQLLPGGQEYRLLIAKRATGQTVFASCNSEEQTPLEVFELLDLQQNPPLR
jgi:hypothetical protein